jgi:hypothetical protein
MSVGLWQANTPAVIPQVPTTIDFNWIIMTLVPPCRVC